MNEEEALGPLGGGAVASKTDPHRGVNEIFVVSGSCVMHMGNYLGR